MTALEIWFKYMQHWVEMIPPPCLPPAYPPNSPLLSAEHIDGTLTSVLSASTTIHTGLLPARWGRLWFNEVSTLRPDTSAGLAFLTFPTICCWMLSLFHAPVDDSHCTLEWNKTNNKKHVGSEVYSLRAGGFPLYSKLLMRKISKLMNRSAAILF